MASKKAPAIGIDLGTTYSCVGVLDFDLERVEIIPNDQGNRTTPSCVAFTPYERLIGENAKSQASMNPENSVYDAKRLIGRKLTDGTVKQKDWPFTLLTEDDQLKVMVSYKGETRKYLPEELSSMVLGKMKETAENYLGMTVTDAVITVPAYFNNSQRKATREAGMMCGLNVLRIINEPTAAAIAYGFTKKTEKEKTNIFLYDLGGGTFDVSVLSMHNVNEGERQFDVASTSGDTQLGGKDFDNRLVNYIIKDFQKKYKKDMSYNQRAVHRVRNECENAKRILSTSNQANINIDVLHAGYDYSTTITRAVFEEEIKDLLEKTIEPMEKALNDAKMKKEDIDYVVLVGGSTRIPKVQEIVRDFFNGKELTRKINTDEAVAHGAALFAAVTHGDLSMKGIQDFILHDVTPLSLGIYTIGGIMSDVIPRNTPIPTRKTKPFYTTRDDQTRMLIQVHEGERPLTKDNPLLGMFIIEGLPAKPEREVNVDVTFDIDVNGILNVSACEPTTGNEVTVTINTGHLSTAEIDRMIAVSDQNKKEDDQEKLRIEAKLDLQKYAFKLRSKAKKRKLKTIHPQEEALSEINKVIQWMDSNPNADKQLIVMKKRMLDIIETQ